MSYKKIYQHRLFFEISVIAIGFVAGYSLWWISFPSRVAEMNFDEKFADTRIYPDFMKSVLVMGIHAGILFSVWLRALFQLFLQRVSDISIAVLIPVLLSLSWLLVILLAHVNAIFFYSDFNLFLIWLIPLIAIGALMVNAIYIVYSFSSLASLRRFFTMPNWYCSIGSFSLVIYVWLSMLSLWYLPL